ncbi:MAG TPA: alanyl-tRNA editing protein, partial [Vicinamibacterales bacterium]|nr:alanyl-tRNA editing protein [Vicinamibacterales bacterium]
MTERLYYTDPYLTEFDARVLDVTATDDGRRAVVLDRTAFYPTSGGQPFDTGSLGAATVMDAVDRDDGVVLHVIEGSIEPGPVHGRIDWPRRFDHMQQHTGQHVLSAAFERLHRARTVSFHLGAQGATIDLARE